MSTVDILLVEDNDGDIRLIERAFKIRELPGTLHTVQTGDKALDWLFQRGEFIEKPQPDLVLLDLNLPATDGKEVLDEIRSDSRLRRLPVIILTSSQSDEELTAVYDLGATAYLRKPVDLGEFMDIIQSFAEFWVCNVELPPVQDDNTDP